MTSSAQSMVFTYLHSCYKTDSLTGQINFVATEISSDLQNPVLPHILKSDNELTHYFNTGLRRTSA